MNDIVFRYLKERNDIEYLDFGTGFIFYKFEFSDYNGQLSLCIYDMYSEDKEAAVIKMLQELEKFSSKYVKYMETYLDVKGNYYQRVKKLCREYGFKPYRKTDEYHYMIKRL
jgi:hypothetical protein